MIRSPAVVLLALGAACSSGQRAGGDAALDAPADTASIAIDAAVEALAADGPSGADGSAVDARGLDAAPATPDAPPADTAPPGEAGPADLAAGLEVPAPLEASVAEDLAADLALAPDAAPDTAVVDADAGAPDAAPDLGAPDAAPLADPLPGDPALAGPAVMLEEVVTMPASSTSPGTSDPRLQRRARINYLGQVPDGSGRLFVPDLNGKLYFLVGGVPRVYLDVGARFAPSFWNHRGLGTGFGFVAFHPDFASNGRFYTVHTEARDALTSKTPDLPSHDNPSHQGVLTEWTAADPAADTFAGTNRELLRLGFSTYIHGIQEVGFDPTAGPGDPDRGLLYVAVGDGGIGLLSGDPQNLAKPHGKILRIDPAGTSGANGRYGIPPGNPFAGRPGALGEIYVYGLRDPHRFSWDASGRRMFVASIGDYNIEAIYEVQAGDNLGWPEREGPFVVRRGDPTCSVYPLLPGDSGAGFVYPVAAYDHDPPAGFTRCLDTGDAVAGGFVYRGAAIPELAGHYLFGDIVNGRLFHTLASEMHRNQPLAPLYALRLVDPQGQPVSMQTLAGDARVDLRFGRDAAGELYLLSKANGKIWRLRRP